MKLIYLLKNTRIHRLSVIFSSFSVIFGMVYAGGGLNFLFESPMFMIAASFFTILGAACVFGVNNVFDVENDKHTNYEKNFLNVHYKQNLITQGLISKREAFIFSIVLGILSLTFFYSINLISFIIALLIIVFGYLYSAPPVRLKSRPYLDLIYHGVFAGFLLFLLGHSLVMPISYDSLIISIPFFFFSIMVQLSNHLPDHDSDKKAGTKTTVVHLGLDKSKKFYKLITASTYLTSLLILITNLLRLIIWSGFQFIIAFNMLSVRKVIKEQSL